MKKPAKLLSVNAYAKLRGIDQKNMRTTLAKVGWSGKVDIEKVDKLIAEAKSARYQKGAPAKGGKVPFAEAERLNKRKADEQAAIFAVNAGLQKLKRNDLAGAISKFREAVRLAPESPQAHYQLALALRSSGEKEDAQLHFQEARRLAPYLKPPDSSE